MNAIAQMVKLSKRGKPHPVMQQLKSKRVAMKLTQQQVAEKCGVHKMTISRAETGTNSPTLSLLVAYADALGVELRVGVQSREPNVTPPEYVAAA